LKVAIKSRLEICRNAALVELLLDGSKPVVLDLIETCITLVASLCTSERLHCLKKAELAAT